MPYYSKTYQDEAIIIRLDGNQMASFTENPENSDWVAYQEWLAEGNTPEPWPPAE
jgi:hypothetical protein